MESPTYIRQVLSRLEEAGFEGYLVGGCVRDGLRGAKPKDFDITTNATPQETLALFSDYSVIETGLQHGTVTVIIDHQPIEITTFRIETTYSDHRHPDQVRFAATIEEDLSRRDFTINAMAMDQKGALIDPFGGREDLEKGLIRCVGEPQLRFSEDALRILRALRFSARFGFEIEPKTKAALFETAPLLKEIAAERILAELKEILVAKYGGGILAEFEPILKNVLPELVADCAVLKQLPPHESLRFAGWLWKMGVEKADLLLRRLRGSNQLRREVRLLIEGQTRSYLPAPERVPIRKALSKMGEAIFFDHLTLQRQSQLVDEAGYRAARELGEKISKEGVCRSVSDLAVGGKELMELGFLGPAIGKLQKRLFEEVMEERLPNEAAALLGFAKNQENKGKTS